MQRFVDEAINRKNLDAIDELVAEEFVEHVPFPGQGPGRDGLRHVIGIFLSAFPDIRWVLDEQVAEGETWSAGLRGRGLIAVSFWAFRPRESR